MGTRTLGWLRTRAATMSLALAALLAGCGSPPAQTGAAPAADSLASANHDEAQRAAIGEAYRERLRLGLGSPFRLVELAMTDPRLTVRDRADLADDLLSDLDQGRAYRVDPAAILPSLDPPSLAELRWARGHLRLIDETVANAPDARTGEAAVRAAYRLAAYEGSIDSLVHAAAVQVAGLARDRRQARADLRALRRAADAMDRPARELVPEWRAARRFRVEAPSAGGFRATAEQGAVELLPYLSHSIRDVWRRTPHAPLPEPWSAPTEALRVAASLPANAAPRVPLVIGVRRGAAWLSPSLDTVGRAAWERFAEGARDEEGFAARLAAAAEDAPALRTALANAALHAAVGMRAYAQERPWHPGLPAPTERQLRERFGVEIETEPELPAEWAASARVGIADALEELRALLPALELRGLTVRLTRESGTARALASHDPGERVLEWPVLTGPGTLAHELAHDLDWQAARRSRGRSRAYASDRAAALGRHGFANALATLAALSPADAPNGYATRPAEVLARSFDWFVFSRLAAQGRSNGTLSGTQDELLTGHESLRLPPGSEAHAGTVLEALRSVINVPADHRRGFLAAYGPQRASGAEVLFQELDRALREAAASAVRSAPVAGPLHRLLPVTRALERANARLDDWSCSAAPGMVPAERAHALREMVRLAAAAHARGAALEIAGRLGGAGERDRMARELFGYPAPWGSDDAEESAADALRVDLAGEVRALERATPAPIPASPFRLTYRCGG